MVVHVAELHAPEESGSHGCRRQDESIEPLKKARTPTSAQRAREMAPSIEERNVIFKVLISLFRPNMHRQSVQMPVSQITSQILLHAGCRYEQFTCMPFRPEREATVYCSGVTDFGGLH